VPWSQESEAGSTSGQISPVHNLKPYVFIQILCFGALFIVLSLSKNRPAYFSKHNVSESGFCLRLPEIGTSSIDWAQLSRFYLKTETECSLRNVVCWKISRTTDNVHKHNDCTNVASSQTFGSYSHVYSKEIRPYIILTPTPCQEASSLQSPPPISSSLVSSEIKI
jgi:hypothetical protein